MKWAAGKTKHLIFPILILFSTYLMVSIILPYTSWRWDVDFLITKQMIIHLDHYRWAFYIHIFSSLIVLVCGSVLFSPFFLRRYSSAHRYLGRCYVFLVLFLSAPSGMVMAFYANGGARVVLSFVLLTPLWWIFTYKGWTAAMNRDFIAHRDWMLRSYALTLSAISLRAYQLIIGQFDFLNPVDQYVFVSWVSWLGNWLVIEIYIFIEKNKRGEEGIFRHPANNMLEADV